MTIVGISGSMRERSLNTALLHAAAQAAPEGMQVEIASIREIPLYDGDVEERSGVPPPVAALKDRIAASDGLLLVTPEYNNSFPGVLKNAIDWMSRPPKDAPRVFRGRPVALMGATPGGGGTILSQDAWLAVFRTLGMRAWFGPKLRVSAADVKFDVDGSIPLRLTDEKLRDELGRFMAGFARFISA